MRKQILETILAGLLTFGASRCLESKVFGEDVTSQVVASDVNPKKVREPGWSGWETIKELPEGVKFDGGDTVSYGENVYKVWQDRRDGNFEIYFKYSKDKGKTWSDDIRLTNDLSYSWHPLLAVNKDGVHIVWEDTKDDKDDDANDEREIYYMKLDHEGNILIPDKRLTYIINRRSRPIGDCARNPKIAADDNAVHAVWETYLVNPWAIGHHGAGGPDVRYMRSTDGGKTWEGKKNFGEGCEPNIALDKEGSVYVTGKSLDGMKKAKIKK